MSWKKFDNFHETSTIGRIIAGYEIAVPCDYYELLRDANAFSRNKCGKRKGERVAKYRSSVHAHAKLPHITRGTTAERDRPTAVHHRQRSFPRICNCVSLCISPPRDAHRPVSPRTNLAVRSVVQRTANISFVNANITYRYTFLFIFLSILYYIIRWFLY